MRTQHCYSPSLRQLLLLSACAVAACSKASMASGDLNGQPNPESNMHGETAAKEERTLSSMKSAVQTLTDVVIEYAEPFLSGKEWFVDRLIQDKIVPGPKMYRTPKFIEVVDRVEKMHNGNNDAAVQLLFDRLEHANKALSWKSNWAIIELIMDIVELRRVLPKPTARRSQKNIDLDETDELESILEKLEKPLLQFLKAHNYDPKELKSDLELEITSSSFFENPGVLLWIDYLAEFDGWKHGGPFDYALIELRQDFDDVEIATKVFAAGANDKDRMLAYGVKMALFRDRSKNRGSFIEFLRQLVPSLEKGILNGPVTFWIDRAKSIWGLSTYPILVRTLVQPKVIQSGETDALVIQKVNELALVDIAADEWSKGFENQQIGKQSTRPSPHAYPISIALIKLWEDRQMTRSDVWELLQIDALEDSLLKLGRKRVWTLFTATTLLEEDVLPALLLNLSKMELPDLLARLVDDDEKLYQKVSKSLFISWNLSKLTSDEIFAQLQLQSPDSGMFLNRRLVLWLGYLQYLGGSRLNQLEALKKAYSGNNFESILSDSVRKSDGMLHTTLKEFMGISSK